MTYMYKRVHLKRIENWLGLLLVSQISEEKFAMYVNLLIMRVFLEGKNLICKFDIMPFGISSVPGIFQFSNMRAPNYLRNAT